jgi:hypothetical protein
VGLAAIATEFAEIWPSTRAQHVLTTPITHNVEVFEPADITLVTAKKPREARWAPPGWTWDAERRRGWLVEVVCRGGPPCHPHAGRLRYGSTSTMWPFIAEPLTAVSGPNTRNCWPIFSSSLQHGPTTTRGT